MATLIQAWNTNWTSLSGWCLQYDHEIWRWSAT